MTRIGRLMDQAILASQNQTGFINVYYSSERDATRKKRVNRFAQD
jgi:hypothetical protein